MLTMHFGRIIHARLHQVKKIQKLRRFCTVKNQSLSLKGLLVENTLRTRCMIVDSILQNLLMWPSHIHVKMLRCSRSCFSFQFQLNA